MTQTHPGPWTYEAEFISLERAKKTGSFFIVDAKEKYVCKVAGEALAKRICNLPDAEAAMKLAWLFLESLPEGWLGHTTGDVGLLNDFLIKARTAMAKAGVA